MIDAKNVQLSQLRVFFQFRIIVQIDSWNYRVNSLEPAILLSHSTLSSTLLRSTDELRIIYSALAHFRLWVYSIGFQEHGKHNK